MGIYLFCLCLGFAGLTAIAFLGHFHGFGHAHHGHGGHSGHALQSGGKLHAHSRAGSNRWLWLSPRVLFSLLFAFGATGFFLEHLLPAVAVVLIALVAAFIFERWLVQPIWRVLFGFASNPARTLDTAVLEEAEAVTNFDRQGHGLIALHLDGQRVQLLARLAEGDRNSRCAVRAGDRLSIIAVDSQRNRCTVTRLPIAAMSSTP